MIAIVAWLKLDSPRISNGNIHFPRGPKLAATPFHLSPASAFSAQIVVCHIDKYTRIYELALSVHKRPGE